MTIEEAISEMSKMAADRERLFLRKPTKVFGFGLDEKARKSILRLIKAYKTGADA